MSDVKVTSGAGSSPQDPPKQSTDTPEVQITSDIRSEIDGALKLLTYAVSIGHMNPTTNETLGDDVIADIKTVAAKSVSNGRLMVSEWAQFESAYYKLARFISPITAQTLGDTEDAGKRLVGIHSPVQVFMKVLWTISILYAVFIVVGEWGLVRYSPVQEGEVDGWNTLMQLVQILTPYAYGGLGACAYLLRSAHSYIHERTFDVRKRPEYFSRIVLGTVSGGAIVLFVNSVSDSGGAPITLSSAALGFVGGYSTDFLFNAIERIAAALLPKIGIQSIKQSKAAIKPPLDLTSGGLTLKELLEKYEHAPAAEKALYKSLIDKLKDRI